MQRLSFIFLVILLMSSNNSFSQNECNNKLKQAEELYTSGEYDNCVQLINTSLKNCSYSKKEKETAYELLVKCYLETDNLFEEDIYSRKIFQNNPFYDLKETNNSEDYNRLIKKYTVLPQLSFGIRNTALRPNFKTTKVFSVLLDDNINYEAPYSTNKTLLMYYGWIEYQFKKNISFNVEFTGLNIDYSRDLSKTNYTVSFKEKMSFFESPLYLKKYFLATKSIFPFASVGLSYLKLLKSTANAQIQYLTESYITGDKTIHSSTLSDIDMLSIRKQNNLLILIGGGVGFRFKNFGLYIDARYYRGANNLTKTSNRFSNSSLINDYFYIDNSIQLNKFEGGISIRYTFKNLIKKSN